MDSYCTSCDPIDKRHRRGCRPRGANYATGHRRVSDQAAYGKWAPGRISKIATWNVRGLLTPGKFNIVIDELKRYNILIAGLSETHWRQSGHLHTGNYYVYHSGSDQSSRNGVAIVVPESINPLVKSYKAINDRIICVRLKTMPIPINLVQAYAPTSDSPDDEAEQFYNQLETTLAEFPNREITIVLGDFNAKIGTTINDHHARTSVGQYGMGERNERGKRLLQFAIDNSLTITNTTFKHHIRHLYTWSSPGNKYRNQIDYILISSRWRSTIVDAKTSPDAVCGSDHQLLQIEFKLKFRVPKQKKGHIEYNMEDPTGFQALLNNSVPNCENKSSEILWQDMKSWIENAAKEYQHKKLIKKQHWMSDATLQLVEERRSLKRRAPTRENSQEIQLLDRQIQTMCRNDKNLHIKNICMEIQNHHHQCQSKDLFAKIRDITRDFNFRSWTIINDQGTELTNIDQVVDRWKQYCEQLYRDQNSNTGSDINELFEREPDILKEEVECAVKTIRTGKACGPDKISFEVLKSTGDTGVKVLLAICNTVWRSGKWPEDWTKSTFIPIFKKGNRKKCENYRTISLISHASKVMLHILHKRIRAFLDRQIPEEQSGFVKGRGTREQILNVRQVIEKAREFNIPVYLCFVDYQKAFDTVKWNHLWHILEEMGLPLHLVHLIKSLYLSNSNTVRIDNKHSSPFNVQQGVRQGCILSPILFNIYGEYIMRKALEKWEGGFRVGGRRISNLRYADDTTLIATSEEELEHLIIIIREISEQFGLRMNMTKTKIMVVDRQNNNWPDLRVVAGCEVVDKFIYLGSLLTNQGGCSEEIRRRIEIARTAMVKLRKIWCDKNITTNTKKMIVNTLVFSIFFYGAETWTVRAADRKRIEAFEMWCWRRMLRVPWTARRTNVSILEELHITQRLSTRVYDRILRYFGHIMRREDGLERLIVSGNVPGKRSRGRSPTRWLDEVRKVTGSPLHESSHRALDREGWRNTIRRELFLYDHDASVMRQSD